MSNIKSNKKEIVLNRMFTGSYLDENTGHEAINFFAADNGSKYVYLCPDGNYGKKRNISDVVLLGNRSGKSTYEIVGWAKNVTKSVKDDKKTKGIKYGEVPLCKIYQNDKQQDIYATFTVEELLIPKEQLFIRFDSTEEAKSKNIFPLVGIKVGQDMRSYIPEDDGMYKRLLDFLRNKERDKKWEPVKKIKKSDKDISLTYMDVCGRNTDENAYSNALKYFIDKYHGFASFWFEGGKSFSLDSNGKYKKLTVKREWMPKSKEKGSGSQSRKGRVDIFIQDETHKSICVIENKILSDIEKIDNDSNQLKVYEGYVSEYAKKDYITHHILLLPNYHPLKADNSDVYVNEITKQKWRIVTYKELYNACIAALNSSKGKNKDNDKKFFDEFIKSIEQHTHTVNDSKSKWVMHRFLSSINKNNKKTK